MFVEHLAVALGIRKAAPRVPLGVLVAATFGLDLLWPLSLLAGNSQRLSLLRRIARATAGCNRP